MDYVEAEGASVDEAIESALQRLGTTRDKVTIEILSNESRGLFGLGGRRAKVRATLRPKLSAESPTESPAPSTEAAAVERAPADSSAGRAPTRRRETAPADTASLSKGQKVLAEIIRLMGIDAQVSAAQGNSPKLEIVGDVSGVLIGRRGQTLDALEYLVNRIITRDEDHPGYIVVDSQNYRERRQQALEDLARRLEERARRRGKTITLNPMSPRDRRIIHLTLQGSSSVVTKSSGEGYYRKLLIIPEGQKEIGRGGRRPRAGSHS
jgi:spoIIIJ-associated protein